MKNFYEVGLFTEFPDKNVRMDLYKGACERLDIMFLLQCVEHRFDSKIWTEIESQTDILEIYCDAIGKLSLQTNYCNELATYVLDKDLLSEDYMFSKEFVMKITDKQVFVRIVLEDRFIDIDMILKNGYNEKIALFLLDKLDGATALLHGTYVIEYGQDQESIDKIEKLMESGIGIIIELQKQDCKGVNSIKNTTHNNEIEIAFVDIYHVYRSILFELITDEFFERHINRLARHFINDAIRSLHLGKFIQILKSNRVDNILFMSSSFRYILDNCSNINTKIFDGIGQNLTYISELVSNILYDKYFKYVDIWLGRGYINDTLISRLVDDSLDDKYPGLHNTFKKYLHRNLERYACSIRILDTYSLWSVLTDEQLVTISEKLNGKPIDAKCMPFNVFKKMYLTYGANARTYDILTEFENHLDELSNQEMDMLKTRLIQNTDLDKFVGKSICPVMVELIKIIKPQSVTGSSSNKYICNICCHRELTHVYSECGHLVCRPCSKRLKSCPFCGKVSDKLIKLFYV